MPGYGQLGQNKKNANNSLAHEVKVKIFSVHKVRTQAFLLMPVPPLFILWYQHNFKLPVNAQE